ncbi:aminotransferase class I/II-fold pyridoxal phosphate-dependent enzyme [Candidatus Peregrinibacteria bacterium]|nr:aminotransferase class I/II-fold pyridoxal phosphate-dependent enzyme [Candidatus Peregrinibacteria bacterium]
MINISLSPNNTWRDTLKALEQLILPWNWLSWKNGSARTKLESELAKWAGVEKAMAVGSGREALYLILKALELPENSEVILQSFTCMVVSNSIIWNGLKPVYADIDETYNLDPAKLENLINERTKVVMVQHTFGIPAQIIRIREICRKHKLILIEDCAHAMGAEALDADGQMRKVGTFGEAAFYSMGRSKVISCVSGGLIIAKEKLLNEKIYKQYLKLNETKTAKIFQNLMHPLICSLAKATYGILIGKIVMVMAQKMRLINFEVTPKEKKGEIDNNFPTKLPNALAKLALIQFGLLNEFNQRRRLIAKQYFEELGGINPGENPGAIYLRYPLQIKSNEQVFDSAKRAGFIIGDWYQTPIAPLDVDIIKSGYVDGSCPKAELMGKEVINLPTMPGLSDDKVRKVAQVIKKFTQK